MHVDVALPQGLVSALKYLDGSDICDRFLLKIASF